MGKYLLLFGLLIFSQLVNAQTLFTYGGKAVTENEFLYSFNRNNTDTGDIRKAMQDYLNLFIRFKLKVQAAKDLRMDTLANQKADLAGFEEQLKPLYLLDQQVLDSLVRQAFERSFSEIKVNHLFFSKEKVTARERADKAYAELIRGKEFSKLAVELSDDPAVENNKGELGYISVFTVPYLFESIIYDLKDGEFCKPVESNAGFHIFQRLNSRAVANKRSYKHILIAIPDGTDADGKKSYAIKADSLYQKAVSGYSFDSLALKFSDDRSTIGVGGLIEEMPIGKYAPLFEEQARSLKKSGDISPVFQTSFGYHILQLANEVPINSDFKSTEDGWRNMVMQDERKEIASLEMIRKSIGKNGLTAKTPDKEKYISSKLPLFSPLFANLLNDFRDGNLLFEIMDKKVWGKAASDLEGQKKFHATRKEKYQWKSSVFAYTITFQKKEDAEAARKTYLKNLNLDELLKAYADIALVDSGRYEAGELMGVGVENAKPGFVSDIFSNISDGSTSFHCVIRRFNDPSIKSFEEARGQLVNDYQQYLEDIWITSLKKKYPVVINEVNWKKLLNKTL